MATINALDLTIRIASVNTETMESVKDKIEAIRIACGLSRPRLSLILADAPKDPEARLAFLQKVKAQHGAFRAGLHKAIDAETPYMLDGVPVLTSRQLARSLGIGDFHIAALRSRGKLEAVYEGRSVYYPVDGVHRFIDAPLRDSDHRSPFSTAFLRFLANRGLIEEPIGLPTN